MSIQKNTSRRSFLRNSLMGLTAGLSATGVAKAAEMCLLTPQQTSGPFYPEQGVSDRMDLTKIPGRPAAKGFQFWITGRIQDENCLPINNALVEIWQACDSGKYAHSNDPNTAPLDPNFLYSGKVITVIEGAYNFKTIKPGAYPASPGWVRPPHIHVKVSAFGYETLVTQLYFADEAELNRGDRILQQIPGAQQDMVVREFQQSQGEIPSLSFDMTLRKP